MGKPLADYVKLPELDEYKDWFKDFAVQGAQVDAGGGRHQPAGPDPLPGL